MPGSRFVVRTLSVVGLVASLPLAVLAAEPPPQGAATSFSGTTYSGTAAGEIRDDNGLRTKLVWIPPGSFVMGSPADEKDRREDESQVQVTFSRGFWLGQHEVTQSEWPRVMRTTPWNGELSVKEGNDFPATFVNWDDAMKFCARLTAIEQAAGRLPKNWKYTLPTEAQWEYACRAGTTTRYSFGPGDSALPDYGWFDKTPRAPSKAVTAKREEEGSSPRASDTPTKSPRRKPIRGGSMTCTATPSSGVATATRKTCRAAATPRCRRRGSFAWCAGEAG